jgi:hypothetical protein
VTRRADAATREPSTTRFTKYRPQALIAKSPITTPTIRFIRSSIRAGRDEAARRAKDNGSPIYLPLKTSAQTTPNFAANLAAATLVTTGFPPEIVYESVVWSTSPFVEAMQPTFPFSALT